MDTLTTPSPQIPIYFRWLNKASYLTYAFAAVVGSEVDGLSLNVPGTADMIPAVSLVPPVVFTRFSAWGNLGILGAQVAGMELIKVAAVHAAYKLRLL